MDILLVKSADLTGLPIACKKIAATVWNPFSGQSIRKMRKHFTANSLYSPSSEPNSETTLIGANRKTKKQITATTSAAIMAIRKAFFTRVKFLLP